MAIEILYRLRYEGSAAEANWLPAHEGTQSLEGISWSLTVLANYLASGNLKSRGRIDDRVGLYIRPAARGSFVNDLIVFVTEPSSLFVSSIAGAYAVSTATDVLNAFIVNALKQVCGLNAQPTARERSWLDAFPSGDLEATIDAIEPGMKRAHKVVGEGASTVGIERDGNRLLTLDHATKAYVNSSIEGDDVVELNVSVGALNVNSGNGRAYLPQVGKTVALSVVKEPDSGTYAVLSGSLNLYARGYPSTVIVRCREYFSNDGRVKKLLVYGAREDAPDPDE